MENLKDKQVTKRRRNSIVNGLFAIAMLLLFASYANLRWANEAPVFEKAKRTADTPAYVRVSGESLFSREFWANTRPPIFPLLLKVYAANKVNVAAFQTAFSIFAWGMLALSLACSLKGFLRPIAFGLVLVLSLERHIAGWDVMMLTESLSISLMVMVLAAWLWLLNGWTWGKVAVLSLIAFLWAFTRDTNAWILLMSAGIILLGLLFFGTQKRYLVVALIFTLIFILSNFSANHGIRWVYPFQNVLTRRILTVPQAVVFFENCGMPITPTLLKTAGGNAESEDRALYVDQELEPYRNWLNKNGKSCYTHWLISRPVGSLREPWRDFAWLLAFEDVSSFYPQRYEPVLPWYVERILYPQDALLWLWTMITFAALLAVWKKAWKTNAAWIVFIGMCLLIYPHVFIVWHGDVSGIHRHALMVSLQFVLGLWLFGLLLTESLLVRFRVRGFV